ncbi:tRNA (adenosine(37)-N6)-threonylcarbamoyltransferase complex dimerization subunit type 1 TsaB [Alteromonas stellipolaris]|jgi:tRNA threonylcarbamoyladenosine biosynthesis protein TsaB|uniref:tRNA (adenosine(37)-N6)-threonylcarbamoyltransferase complex dimerization subunit type 1 TsaB n=1 Tax=Alteromonas stellipolaris TaxID=233316 RepID=UPI0026E2A2AD|nr:tRNA (adenosine(37)-N6)-threonylcarbamoyltransferase complex dimerization subunit type 1 TsaB [Alteromonas stellipolaris]MDO6534665.1 tRNA (adenosine(37)-N6)-threonylcarbamoyltransferase complex dimerization subunit type 1 TsaB [Alteromonas stellipolaris]MDO6626542.1 tRNA (adenosine(37)-N6)-threonylcarbamoyltransferase complex dimerization subunit type 1 TsaB [Alteromonas stellipolaris]
MKVLAIDTATEACSVALNTDSEVVSRFEICPQQHSQRLLPMLDEVLKDAGLVLADLDLLAFGRGPGSFTGVRIATGMVQGLSLGSGLKVAGVSTLAAMAQQALATEQTTTKQVVWVVCATDARMGEVYFAIYKSENGSLKEVVAEQVCPPEIAVELIKDTIAANQGDAIDGFEPVGTGWQAYPALEALLPIDHEVSIQFPDAVYMLPLAEQLANKGDVQVASDVKPVYLRDKVTWKKLPGRE